MAVDMQTFTSVSDAARAVQEFLFDREAALPDELREKLKLLVGPATSPVDTVVQGAELMYARKKDLAPEALALAAGLALIAEQYNFHGMAQDNRGSRVALAMLRDAKARKPSLVEYPDAADDPEPKSDFMPLPEVVESDIPPPPVEDAPVAEGARRGRGTRNRRATNTK